MAGLMKMTYIEPLYDRYTHFLDSIGDPRVNDWFLMESPVPTVIMVGIYLYIVIFLGPWLMANRKPFKLKTVLVVYNAFQVIFSLAMLWEHLMSGWLLDYSYKCQPVDYSHSPTALRAGNLLSRLECVLDCKYLSAKCMMEDTAQEEILYFMAVKVLINSFIHITQMANLCWWYYISKLTEFVDTLFFVMRKKDNQISLLHLYHHSLTPLETWICVKFLAGGHGTFSNLINNIVHVIMYFYYMMSAMGPEYQKYLWWKRHLTTLQLLQFTLVFFHSAQVLIFDCGYPKLVAALLLVHSTIFFGLFFDFYQQAYKKNQALQAKKIESDALLANKKENGSMKQIENGSTKKMENGVMLEKKISNGALLEKKLENGAAMSNKMENGLLETKKAENGALPAKKID